MQPFFSIGVPTYNRHDLLRETLDSILSQGFTDFEVLVGNDYTAEVLTGESLGVTDPRVRFVNHPHNLREVGNMNALLELAAGRYFTWIFDDDLYEPGFLQTAHDCLAETGFPPGFFSSFRMLRDGEEYQPGTPAGGLISLTGNQFLRRYAVTRPPEIASTCGVFDTAILRATVGGVEELCPSAIGVYCEYLFLVRLALLERIVYIDAPYYVFRVHADSWSENTAEVEKYLVAGPELVKRCANVLRHPSLVRDYSAHLLMVCEQHLYTMAHRFARIEVAEGNLGPAAVCRALGRYLGEAGKVKRLYRSEGGGLTPHTLLSIVRMNIHCYRTILLTIASYLYRSFR